MSRLPQDDLYVRLGVPPTADAKQIQKAWRAKMRELHPDRRPDDLWAHAEAARLNEAREILTDSLRRADYDLHRREQQRAGASSRTARSEKPRREPPPPPPPRPSPPPRRPRVVLEPPIVDFGSVRAGDRPTDQQLIIRMSDGSPLEPVTVRHHWGGFWQSQQYEQLTGRTVTVVFEGRSNANLAPGPHEDLVEVAVGDERFIVQLRVRVEAAPAQPAEPGPSRPTPEPEPSHNIPRQRWPVRVALPRHLLTLTLVLVVLAAGGAWLSSSVLGTGHHPVTHTVAAAAKPADSPYCKITDKQGVVAYYSAAHGKQLPGRDAVWYSMAAPPSDPWVTWWTPQFQYWERANGNTGYQDGMGQTYGQYRDLQVSIIWEQGWEPLNGMIQRHPEVNGEAEAKMRKQFLGEWIKYLGSPQCT